MFGKTLDFMTAAPFILFHIKL